MRSGLVNLLDKLCNLEKGRVKTDSQSTRHLVSVMAWAGFQVLSTRCVTWEKDEGEMEN